MNEQAEMIAAKTKTFCCFSLRLASRYLGMRSCLIALTLVLLVCPWSRPTIGFIDRGLLASSTWFMSAPKGVSDIAVIEVEREQYMLWQNDIGHAGELSALLSNILHASQSVIGLVLEHPLDSKQSSVDILLANAVLPPKASGLREAKAHVLRKNFLVEALSSERVVLGLPKAVLAKSAPVPRHQGSDAVSDRLLDWLWPADLITVQLLPSTMLDHYPLTFHPGQRSASLLVQADVSGNTAPTYHASFSLALMRAANLISVLRAGANRPQNAEDHRNDSKLGGREIKDSNNHWRRDLGFVLGDRLSPTSPLGRYLPVHTLDARMRPLIGRISVNEALARSAFPSMILIAPKGDDQVFDLAAAMASLQEGRILHSPWWSPLLQKSLLFVIALLSLLVLTRVSLARGAVIVTALVIGLVLLSLVAILVWRWYLPISDIVLWLLFCHVVLLFWLRSKRRQLLLCKQLEMACVQHANQLKAKDDLVEAAKALAPCLDSDTALQCLYDIANAHVDKKEYAQAIANFETIRMYNKRFRDVQQKIDVLQSMSATPDRQDSNEHTRNDSNTQHMQSVPTELGRYQVKDILGQGAMGVVYLGYDPKIGRQVAIKTLRYQDIDSGGIESTKARFFREAEAAGRLSHPNIISVFDVGEEAGLAYIAMDLARGSALSDFVTSQRLLPVFEVYRVVADVAAALVYAHQHKIVHRDIKPSNIIYHPSPYQIKVTDFGIARVVDQSRTGDGAILGSPLYMAPEQLNGENVSCKADVYSLGVSFYQLLTGRLPFNGDNLAALSYEVLHGKHQSVRAGRKDIPLSAARIINQAMQKDPQERYESAADMAQAIKKAMQRDFPQDMRQINYV